jgi:nucleoside-diphosphate-sugar epimerase
MTKRLFCFGLGYSARALLGRLPRKGWTVAGTARSVGGQTDPRVQLYAFDGTAPLDPAALNGVSHVLVSAPPDAAGDPVLRHCAAALAALPALEWVGYLSTTGVYGDHGGRWVDETTPVTPQAERSRRRAEAERAWLDSGLPVHVFRLAGIYGSGRSIVDDLLAGTARRIDRPGHVFSRIHVDDIAGVLMASMARPNPRAIYNVCDDEPAEPRAVVEYAAKLLNMELPPLKKLADAGMSPMGLSFWADHKRVRNDRIKDELGARLFFPSYREGLAAIVEALEIARVRRGA